MTFINVEKGISIFFFFLVPLACSIILFFSNYASIFYLKSRRKIKRKINKIILQMPDIQRHGLFVKFVLSLFKYFLVVVLLRF